MKLSEKITRLRKSHGMSQEELGEQMHVSRQAVSRWETGAVMPDAQNILQLGKLFGVTADYLLNDEYESDEDLPGIREIRRVHLGQIRTGMVTLELMILLMQVTAAFILQRDGLVFLGFIPFVALLGGFEYGWQRRSGKADAEEAAIRRQFYRISVWLGAYFPVRFLVFTLARLYPGAYPALAVECVAAGVYVGVAVCGKRLLT